uniref:CRISPR type III-B/RAMP module-associated protein Cmr5 n=1 Tax=Desulfobacca acetoxidans TaxID=60893 RepID=A0A7V4G7I3_9BACT
MTTTLAQQRAAFALEQLRGLNLKADDMKSLATLLKGLPATILLNGFGQTLAYLLAKGAEKESKTKTERTEKDYQDAFRLITQWLRERRLITHQEPGGILHELAQMYQPRYLQAQEEALALLEWAKRFAAAGLGVREVTP